MLSNFAIVWLGHWFQNYEAKLNASIDILAKYGAITYLPLKRRDKNKTIWFLLEHSFRKFAKPKNIYIIWIYFVYHTLTM